MKSLVMYWRPCEIYARGMLPADVQAQLEQIFSTQVIQMMAKNTALLDLGKKLAQAEIAFVVVKGPIMAAALLNDPYTRYFKDLDILVHEEALKQTRAILEADGFLYTYEAHIKLPYHYKRDFDRDYDIAYIHPKKNLKIELHWGLGSPALFPITDAHLWQRLETVRIGQMEFANLSPNDQFLYIAVHGFRHHWRMLKWLCDADNFIQRYPEFDWETLLHEAAQRRIRRLVLLALALAHNLLGSPIPTTVAHAIRSEYALKPLAAFAEFAFFEGIINSMDSVKAVFFHIDGREYLTDKATYLLQYAMSFISTRHSQMFRRVGFSLFFFVWLAAIIPIELNKRRRKPNL